MAQRELVAFADELEDARALRDVVVRLRQPIRRSVQRPAQAKELTPRAGHGARVDAARDAVDSLLGVKSAPASEQRLARDELRLNRFRRRRLGRNFVRQSQRVFVCAAPRRELGFEHTNRPLVPQAGLPAVAAIRFAGLTQVIARCLVSAAGQRDLRQCVVDGARDLVEL